MLSKKNPAHIKNGKPGGKKKVTEFKFNFDIRMVFITLFTVLFFGFVWNSVSKEIQSTFPEKPITMSSKTVLPTTS